MTERWISRGYTGSRDISAGFKHCEDETLIRGLVVGCDDFKPEVIVAFDYDRHAQPAAIKTKGLDIEDEVMGTRRVIRVNLIGEDGTLDIKQGVNSPVQVVFKKGFALNLA